MGGHYSFFSTDKEIEISRWEKITWICEELLRYSLSEGVIRGNWEYNYRRDKFSYEYEGKVLIYLITGQIPEIPVGSNFCPRQQHPLPEERRLLLGSALNEIVNLEGDNKLRTFYRLYGNGLRGKMLRYVDAGCKFEEVHSKLLEYFNHRTENTAFKSSR